MRLNGEVAADRDMWLYEFFEVPAFSPQTVRDAIDNTPEGEELVLEINSGGGSVFAGFEMYSVLRASPRRTVAEVQSLAGSAASVVMTGCQEVCASPVAQVMIHLPTTYTEGDRYDHQDSIGVLDSVTDSILNAYAVKCGGKSSRPELRGLMRASTWLTAPEAKGLGLVDRIIGEESFDPSAVLNACGGGRGIRAMAARPATDYGSLLARYQALVAEGKAPERAEALRGTLQESLPPLGEGGTATAVTDEGNAAPSPHQSPAATASPQGEALETALAQLELEKIRFGGI